MVYRVKSDLEKLTDNVFANPTTKSIKLPPTAIFVENNMMKNTLNDEKQELLSALLVVYAKYKGQWVGMTDKDIYDKTSIDKSSSDAPLNNLIDNKFLEQYISNGKTILFPTNKLVNKIYLSQKSNIKTGFCDNFELDKQSYIFNDLIMNKYIPVVKNNSMGVMAEYPIKSSIIFTENNMMEKTLENSRFDTIATAFVQASKYSMEPECDWFGVTYNQLNKLIEYNKKNKNKFKAIENTDITPQDIFNAQDELPLDLDDDINQMIYKGYFKLRFVQGKSVILPSEKLVNRINTGQIKNIAEHYKKYG